MGKGHTLTEIRKHSHQDETYQLGIDFDGVIHRCSKGFYDGTIYDDLLPGAREAIEELSKSYVLICYTAKARSDRPLIGGKTGTELVSDWLLKHDLLKYFKDVTAEKPRAVCYIDDKGVRFNDWPSTIKILKNLKIL